MPVSLGRNSRDHPRRPAGPAAPGAPQIERDGRSAPAPPPFGAALRRRRWRVIAEVKRRSPSAGVIRDDLDPAERAARYGRHGAAAISVLTDGPYFGGSIGDLRAVTSGSPFPSCARTSSWRAPVLEARRRGASAVLLIVRRCRRRGSASSLGCAGAGTRRRWSKSTPAPSSTRRSSAGARSSASTAGTWTPSGSMSAAAWKLLAAVPADCVAVAESGMATVSRRGRAAAAGRRRACWSARLSRGRRSGKPAARSSPRCRGMAVEVKICGLTRAEDAARGRGGRGGLSGRRFRRGARLWHGARRARSWSQPADGPVLGVFAAQPVARFCRSATRAGLRGAQLHGAYTSDDAHRLAQQGLRVWRCRCECGAGRSRPDLRRSPRSSRRRAGGAAGGARGGRDRRGAALALAREARAGWPLPMVLAGGLRPRTSPRRVALVRPDIVDVSSGVETPARHQGPRKIARFRGGCRWP